jgi:hypothetical protein
MASSSRFLSAIALPARTLLPASTEILAREGNVLGLIALRAWGIARNRPRLVSLQSETDQGHEQVDVLIALEVKGDPMRAGHHAYGGRPGEMVLEPPDGTGREVQVNVAAGVKVDDLAVG